MIELVRKRRSVREYKSKTIPTPIVEEFKEILLRSPTSRNRKDWLFWFVTDKNMLSKLANSKASGSQMIKDSALSVVIGADESLCDVWVEDCSIAATLLQMSVEAHDLGSVWVQIRERKRANGDSSEDYIKELLSIDNENIKIEAIISIGYPTKKNDSIPFEDLDFSKIKEVK
jgi:nitroreductase